MHKILTNFSGGGSAPSPDPTFYLFASYFKILDPSLTYNQD